MRRDTTGRTPALLVAVACALVVCSALAVAPGGVTAQQQQLDGEIAFEPTDGELRVEVDRRDAANGSFTGDPENVTIDIEGTTLEDRRDDPGNTSTYTYTVGPEELTGVDTLDGRDGSGTTVTVTHSGAGSFNRTVDIQYVVLDGDGAFATDGTLQFGTVRSFGVGADGSVGVRVETDNGEQNVSATYRTGTDESSLVLDRDALGTLGVLERPQNITVFGQERYVQGSATVDVASAAAKQTGGQRLADGSGVVFESPLFVDGRPYAVTIATDGARYLRSIEAGGREIEVDSAAVAAASTVDLTVERNGNAIVDGRTIDFATATVTGNASGATITFDSLPERASGANVSAVWVEVRDGVERYEAGLNATTRTLTLSNTESLPRADANETDLLVQFEGATPLHATVALQSDGGGTVAGTNQSQNQSGVFGLSPGTQSTIILVVGVLVGIAAVAIVVFVVLSKFASDSVKSSLPFVSSKSESNRDSPETETAEVSVEVIDGATGGTYPHATRVVAQPKNPTQSTGAAGSTTGHGPGGGTGPAGVPGVNTDDTERIDLTAGTGEAELEYGAWVFEVKQNGQTIGRRAHDLKYGFESDQINLSVEPHVVEAVVTGGPDREPLAGATVEATADTGSWTQRKPTDAQGSVTFEVPRAASAVSFTATYEDLPSAQREQRIEQATQEGVTLPIAAETGTMTVETTVGDRPWPEVDVRITPISEDAKAYTDEGTVTTKSGGRRTVEGLPTGEYEVTAHPQVESVDTTAAVERVTVEDDGTVEVDLPIGISYTMSTAQRDRISELEDRIEGLASASNRDVTIPQYYGTVLTSVLDLVEDIESSPERAAGAGVSPDATVEALLDATDAGISAVDAAMSERRNVKLFGACESMPDASVAWSGAATLDAFLDRVNEGGDHERRALRDRLRAVDEVLDQQWGEVNEIAPARKVHDRIGELARETGDIDDELVVVAQTYVGICLLDAVEGIFDHDALVDRLNSGSY